MANLGDLLFVRAEYRVYNSDRSNFQSFGEHNILIPYGDDSTRPQGGNIVLYGLTTSKYEDYRSWMSNFGVLYQIGINNTANECPNANFHSYFPEISSVQTDSGYNNPVLVFSSGKVLRLSDATTGITSYASISDYENDIYAYKYSNRGMWGFTPTGSGASRGSAWPIYYTSLDADGNIDGLSELRLTGTASTMNTIGVENRNAFPSAMMEVIKYCFDGEIQPITPPGEDDDPYAGIDGEGEISGGGSGAVGIPGFPGLTATGAGVIGLFAPSAAQMRALSDYMWTDFGGTGTTTDEILGEIVQALKRSISNPLDYVVGLNIIPSQGLSIGGSSTIRFGFTSSGVSMPRLSNQYFTVNCGSLSFAAVCGNTFLDYAPYSKFSIYLPYIGVKEVDANDFVGHTIGVTYHGDVVTGGVTAYITKDGSVMYQYSGCCALNVPLSADGWGSTIAGAVQIATSMVAAFGGGAAGIATAAAEGAASVAANPSLLSPQVSHSGAVSGGAGCMGVQYPFVIRETVRFHSTSHFNKLSGYPSFYYRLLNNVEGYTKVLDVHLNSIPATVEEVTEIETLLKRGVIL